ncbi:M13 family metallopeptidase [Sphingomonas sp. So64.6b]|uniref:M13 family metallopeptidase n=1 Tax=Sphingomonas sp. So64.6b TaxID=2997354 RepID=UPI0015FF2AEE|nr:M13 family metallopeptidase [Sphingomonas sp. So64.6b]QNA83710.1 M13 family metallopeptidase [Sphingomonas sp. So64.6b]
MSRTPFVTLLLSATAFIGCAAASSSQNAPVIEAAAKPSIGSFGFDETGMDRKVAPGDDFYDFANGAWVEKTPIPADKANFGAFDLLQDLSRERTRGILEAAKAKPGSKIGAAYAAYLDQAAIEAKGLAPIKPWLNKIKALKSPAGYAALVAEADRNGVGVPFNTGVSQDQKNPDAYALQMRQGGLGLPDRDFYLDANDAKLAAAKTAYQAHIAKMFTFAGEPDADARARAIVDFETGIAQVSWTRAESRDADKTYNKMTVADLGKSAPGFDFATYFRGIGIPADSVIVGQPSAISGIAKLIGATPVGVLRDQLLIRSLEGFASVLPTAFDKENFAMFSTVLSGTPEQQARWKRGVDYTSGVLTDDVSKLYVAQYFPPETKAAADALVKNIITAMNARIDKLDWMAPETKVKAHAKLAAFTPRIGYPDKWRDYSALRVAPGDAFGNTLRANQWAHDYNAGKLGKPIYRWEWGLAPMTVNAQANPTLVAITFPAAILQPPFFDPNADPAINYGGIGAVIGHEMSHHFDDQGAKYDLKGRLTDWWTPADVASFKKLTGNLVAQYDAYEPLPGRKVNGTLTLGENTADLAGLSASFDAYHASLGGKPAPVIDGFTGDQRFYLGWAQVWRRSYREADMIQRLKTDPHAPSQLRAGIVRNLDPWYGAFEPEAGEKLYLAPEQRVRIW